MKKNLIILVITLILFICLISNIFAKNNLSLMETTQLETITIDNNIDFGGNKEIVDKNVNKKYSNNDGIILEGSSEYSCSWYPDNDPMGGYKKCKIEFYMESKDETKNLYKDLNFDFTSINKYNPRIFYSGECNEEIEEIDNSTYNRETKEMITNSTLLVTNYICNNYIEYAPSKVIDLSRTSGFKIEFDMPKYNEERFNIEIIGKIDDSTTPTKITLDPDVSACGTLDTDGATYTLLQNIQSTGTCITINGENIIFNCNGNMINYSSTIKGTGILINYANGTTINNCLLLDKGSGGASYAKGISFKFPIQNVSISNTNINTTGLINFGICAEDLFCDNVGTNKIGNNLTFSNININLTDNSGPTGFYIDTQITSNITINNMNITVHSTSSIPFDIGWGSSRDVYINRLIINPTYSGFTSSGLGALELNNFGNSYNTIVNNSFINGGMDIALTSYQNASIYNSILISGGKNIVTNVEDNAFTNLTNVTWNNNLANLTIGENRHLYGYHYVEINVTDGYNNHISGANVNISNASGKQFYYGTTDTNGRLPRQVILEHFTNATGIYGSNNYSIIVNKSGYSFNHFSFNLTNSSFITIKTKTYSPSNPFISIENQSPLWNYSGNFSGINTTSDFSSQINSYLSSCTSDEYGNCTIPIIFHSDTAGKLKYSDIKVYYNYTYIDSVWLIIWEGLVDTSNKLWEGFLSFISGAWTSEEIEINESFSPKTNYSVYVNDTLNNKVIYYGNLSVNQFSISNLILNASDNPYNTTEANLTAYWTISDADFDNVKNITNWYLNNKSITLLNIPFEGGSNNTFTKNYAGLNNGTIGEAIWSSTAGYDSFGAYNFNGKDNYIKIENSNELSITGPFSVEAWIYRKGDGSSGTGNGAYGIIGKAKADLSAKNSSFAMALLDTDYIWDLENRSYFGISNGSKWYGVNSNERIENNKWYHLVDVWNGTDVLLYINGNFDNSASANININSINVPIIIGGLNESDPTASTSAFNGTIDDVRIYNRSLSAEQIKFLFENKTNMLSSQETSINDIWDIEVTVNDGTSDSNTGSSNPIVIL